MRSILAGVLMLLLSCSSAGVTAAHVQREIQAEYDRLAAAFNARSIDGVLSFRAPEFEAVGPQGQRDDYARMAEYTRVWIQNNQNIKVEFQIESLKLPSPDEARVRVMQRASRTQEIEGKTRHVEHEVRQRETWVRTPGGWKLRMVDQIDLANRKRWVDGVLQPAGSAGGTAAPKPTP